MLSGHVSRRATCCTYLSFFITFFQPSGNLLTAEGGALSAACGHWAGGMRLSQE